MTNRLRLRANGKINLCLILGQPRAADAKHNLASVFLPVDLADTLTLAWAPEGAVADGVICEGVAGENLAAAAIDAWRERSGWDGPPVELTIEKRIPVAAGMGGGSADAAGALRLIAAAAGRPDDPLLSEIAPDLGADVPGLLHGGALLAQGAGEFVTEILPPAEAGFLIVPSRAELSTPKVFAKAAEMGLRRADEVIDQTASRILETANSAGWQLPDDLLGANDLQAAAIELEPSISSALTDVQGAGCQLAFVTGSGPTVVGMFPGSEGLLKAQSVAQELASRHPAAVACAPSPRSATIEEIA